MLHFYQNLKLKNFITSKITNLLSKMFTFGFIAIRQCTIRRGTELLASLVRFSMRGTNLIPIWLNVLQKGVTRVTRSSGVKDSHWVTNFTMSTSKCVDNSS